jgi:hypothetical protein
MTAQPRAPFHNPKRPNRPDSVGQYTNLPPPAQQEHFKRNAPVSGNANAALISYGSLAKHATRTS